jgi:hypothetical protein
MKAIRNMKYASADRKAELSRMRTSANHKALKETLLLVGMAIFGYAFVWVTACIMKG